MQLHGVPSSDDLTATHYNVVTATAVDDDNTPATDDDDATVTFSDVAPHITVTKTASPTHVPETGADVTFTVTVLNDGTETVVLTGAIDTVYGPIPLASFDKTILAVGQTATATFSMRVEGDASGPAHYDVATVDAVDHDGTPCSGEDDERVTFDDVAPQIAVTKTADPTEVPETGGDVNFTIAVTNTGSEPVMLIGAVDTVFGPIDVSLFDKTYLMVGDAATYSFTEWLASDSLAPHTNVVTVTAEDNEGTDAADDDDATVTFSDVAPPIRITKTANPTSVPETGGDVTFTFLVENIGQEDVTLTSLTDTVFGDLNGQGSVRATADDSDRWELQLRAHRQPRLRLAHPAYQRRDRDRGRRRQHAGHRRR